MQEEECPTAPDGGQAGDDAERLMLLQRVRELEQQNMRLLADFENARRRRLREQEELQLSVRTDVVQGLLPIADDLQRAREAAEEESAVAQGIALVERGLQSLLQRLGAEPVAALGATFDPALHEAVMEEPSDQPPGTVTGELRRGYRIGDRVVRPALVRVARAPDQS